MSNNPTDTLGRPLPTIDAYYGLDGTLVVHVDTEGVPENERGPIIRVYLNDGDALFANPEHPTASPAHPGG